MIKIEKKTCLKITLLIVKLRKKESQVLGLIRVLEQTPKERYNVTSLKW